MTIETENGQMSPGQGIQQDVGPARLNGRLRRVQGYLLGIRNADPTAVASIVKAPNLTENSTRTDRERAFARELLGKGFFTEDLRTWHALDVLYAQRPYPHGFTDKLILEAYVSAWLTSHVGGDKERFKQYFDISDRLGLGWNNVPLGYEMDFLNDTLSARLRRFRISSRQHAGDELS